MQRPKRRSILGRAAAPAPAADPAPPAAAPAGEQRARTLVIGALLFVGSLTLYLANGTTVPFELGGDSIPNRLIPFSILRYGTVTMDPFREPFASRGGYRWYAQDKRGRLVSFYALGTPIVALPIYAPLYAYLQVRGRTSAEELFAWSEPAEKIAASTMTAATVVLTWLALRRRTDLVRATWIAAVLAGASLLWPVASQVLWQHTPGALLVAGVLALSAPGSRPRPWWTGLALGLLFIVRTQALFFAAGAVAALVAWGAPGAAWRERLRALAGYGLGFALPAIPHLLYSRYYFGSWMGVYGGYQDFFSAKWLLEGTSGLLFSPNRGLFVLMPIALVGVVGAWRMLHQPRRDPALSGLLIGGVLFFALHAASRTWAGGWCFGPRYLTEVLPVLAVAAPLALTRRPSRLGQAMMALALLWSLLMQLAGAWFYPASRWNARMEPNLERAAWDGAHFMPWEDFQAWRRQRAERR